MIKALFFDFIYIKRIIDNVNIVFIYFHCLISFVKILYLRYIYYFKLVMKKHLPKTLERLIKIFFIGLLVQFFLQTLVTYKLGLEWWVRTYIWLWKEIFILVFIIFVWAGIITRIKQWWWNNFYQQLKNSPIFKFLIFFICSCIFSFLVALWLQKVGLGVYILSLKYDFLGFLIFLLWVWLARYTPLKDIKYENWYQNILKFTVYWGVFWWLILFLVPWTLRLAGYSRETFEWTIWWNPPAVYYTEINRGFIRNQFLFERPISFWFFLIAFWPLFALWYLRKQTRKYQLLWMIFYGFLVASTLSRAAIGVWILQTAIIILLLYYKQAKKIIYYFGIPAFIILFAGVRFLKWDIIRTHSDTWHVVLLKEGMSLGMENPLIWWWVWYSWPASHQICYEAEDNTRCEKIKEINSKYEISTYWYNPENQYVQIFMEYWLLWLIPRILCFWWLIREGLKVIKPLMNELKKTKKLDQKEVTQLCILFAFWLWMLWLALEWLVLHSFVDRMIVYPYMLLFGLVRWRVNKEENK